MPRPFLVVATQNPVEMDGTYRLPEAQLDRFLMKLSVGYPDEAVEIEVLRGAALRSPDALDPVTDTATVGEMVRMAQRVHIADPLYAYAVRLAAATRDHQQVRVGVSPRGVIALTRAACAYALIDGRGYVLPEDLKALVEPVFAHRLLLTPDAQLRGVTAAEVLRDAVALGAGAAARPASSRPGLTGGAACRITVALRVGLLVGRASLLLGARLPLRLPRAGAARRGRRRRRRLRASVVAAWRPRLAVTRAADPDRVARGEPAR